MAQDYLDINLFHPQLRLAHQFKILGIAEQAGRISGRPPEPPGKGTPTAKARGLDPAIASQHQQGSQDQGLNQAAPGTS